MADVFISYAREDRSWVEMLAEEIENTGLTVWWDRRQRLGKSFDEQIVAELADASAVVVVWSKTSLGSMWVKDEATEGRDRGILLPILKDGVSPPLGFKQLHSADLSDWKGGPHDEMRAIMKELRVLAGKTVLEPPVRKSTPAKTVTVLAESNAAAGQAAKAAHAPSITRSDARGEAKSSRSLWSRAASLLGGIARKGNGAAATEAETAQEDDPEVTTILPPAPTREIRVELTAEMKGHDAKVLFAAFSPDGRRILTSSSDQTARLWNAVDGLPLNVMLGHSGSVETAAYAPDGTRIATGSWDNDIRLWDGEGGAVKILEGHTDDLDSLQFSPDGKTLASGAGDMTARLWDVASGACKAVLEGHEAAVRVVGFSSDGRRLVTGAWDDTARLWDLATNKSIAVLRGHRKEIQDAAFSPDGTRIVTASYDGTARIWDGVTGAAIRVLNGHSDTVWAAAFSPDGTRIATASSDKTARLWDAKSGETIAVLARHGDRVSGLAFSPAGGLLVTVSDDKTARLWDAITGAPMAALSGHGKQVWHAAFAPDGSALVTASADCYARLWGIAG